MTERHPRGIPAASLALAAICSMAADPHPAGAGLAVAPFNPPTGGQVEFPRRVIRGTVVDEEGRPVVGATVRTNFRDKAIKPATTGADGAFTLDVGGFVLVEESLFASAGGGVRMGLGKHIEPGGRGPVEPVRIVLKPSRIVRVHVRDAAGAPVDGAAIEAVGFDYQGSATADPDGDATLRVPADAEILWVIALKSGAGFDYFENYEAKPVAARDRARPAIDIVPLPAEVTLTLDGARTTRIRAVDTAGRPVPAVDLRTQSLQKPGKIREANVSGSAIARARTDGDGIATVDWLPSRLVRPAAFLTSPGPYSCPESPTDEPEGGPGVLEARMLRATTIRGVVRGPDGRPAAGVLVRAEGRGATNLYCRMHTRTAQDGSYRFEVAPEQSYMLAVFDDRHAARTLTGVVVREGQPRDGLDIDLIDGTLLHGRVTAGKDRTPVAGAIITLVQRGERLPNDLVGRFGENAESLPRWATTDADGRYRIRVGPGHYQLYGAGFRRVEALEVGAEAEIVRDFENPPDGDGR